MPDASTDELAWLFDLADAMAAGADRRAVIGRLGESAGADPLNPTHTRVKPRVDGVERATVYPLPHISIEVAVDLRFRADEAPALAKLEARWGKLRPMPRSPDDFHSGPKRAAYLRPPGSRLQVRIFAELTGGKKPRVVGLHLDAEPTL